MIRKACLAFLCSTVAIIAQADDPQQPPDKSDEPVPAAKSAKPDAGKPDPSRPAAAIDADLLKALEKQSAPREEEENPLLRVGQRMRDVQGRLVKSDTADETRSLQQGIVQDLDKLIDEMKKGGRCPTCGAANCTKHGNAKRNTSQNQSRSQASQPNKASEPNEGQVTAKPGTLSDAQIQASRVLVREVWGHLPDKLKEEMQQAFKEGNLPKYQVMIERYFRAIAEQNDSRK